MQSGFWNSFTHHRAGHVGNHDLRAPRTMMWLTGVALAAICSAPLVGQAETVPQQIGTETQLTASVAHTVTGTRATFRVHVAPYGGDANATGVVTLVDGATDIGSGVLNVDGETTIATPALLPGVHAVHALYNGSETLATSVSAESSVTAETGGVATFTAAASPTALNVVQGNTISTTITLTPQNGFSNYVSLSCSVLPPDSTCTFLPTNVLVSGLPATTVLSIETYGPTGTTTMVGTHSNLVYALLFPGLLGLAGLGLRRRDAAWRNAGLVLLVLVGMGAMNGCSQRYKYLNKVPFPSPGTPIGSTNITVEAQSTSGVVVTTQLIQNVVLTVKAPS